MADIDTVETDRTDADGGMRAQDSGADSSDLARIRVHARSAGGPRVPMLGLMPRAVIEAMRRRVHELAASTGSRPLLAAQVVRVESVKVSFDRENQPVPARRVYLALSVESAPPKTSERSHLLQRELDALVQAAEHIKSREPARELA